MKDKNLQQVSQMVNCPLKHRNRHDTVNVKSEYHLIELEYNAS